MWMIEMQWRWKWIINVRKNMMEMTDKWLWERKNKNVIKDKRNGKLELSFSLSFLVEGNWV